MSDVGEKRFDLTVDDVSQYPWQQVCDKESLKECHAYYSAFNQATLERKEQGDELGCKVYSFIAAISSFHGHGDNEANPYGPMWSGFDGKRSLQPDDLSQKDLDLLAKLLPDIEDPEFRARVADVLWVMRKDFKAAQVAVEAFIQSSERLKDGERWPPFLERLDRATQIAAIRGFEPQRARVVAAVEQTIKEFKDDRNTGLACLKLMGILLKLDEGDRVSYAKLAEDLARGFAGDRNWRFSQEYWRVARTWHLRQRNENEAQRCALEAAECDISNAEEIISCGKRNMMSSAHWMSRGFETLRQAKADPKRIQEVHTKLLQIQKESTKELGTIQFSEDQIPGLNEERERVQQASVELVAGLTIEEAIERFALAFKPTDYEALKKRDDEQAKQSPLSRMFSSSMMDLDGKVTDRMPGISPGEEGDSAAFRKRLVQSARMIDWNVSVNYRIEPARFQIYQEHPLRLGDLWFLVRNNPFIEPGHEGIYLHGVQAGFFGDWLTAMHLLVPQIESSIRFILKQQGIITSTMDSEGIQKERDLNQLLWMDEVEEIFGPNILFDLRGILIERFGCNLRNELAHGLMPEGAFYCAEAPYIWWLIVHLLYIGHINIKRTEENPDVS